MHPRCPRLLALALVAAMAATLAAQSSPATIGGALPPLFPVDNWWNQDISQAPVAPESAALINFINNGGTRRLHPDFGGVAGPNEIYGLPYVVVAGDQPKRQVQFYYAGESDGVGVPFYPIPDQAKTQPYWIEGGAPGNQAPGGDRHMLLVDKDNRRLYELFDLGWNGSQWTAGSGAYFDLQANGRRPDGWTSADAAGLAILPGLVKYDEVYGPGEITHAFRVTVRATNDHYVWPASHVAGNNTSAPPNGTRLRLKASKDISGFPPEIQKIFRAMKTHGLIVADNGSDMYVGGAFDPRWNNDVLNPAFRGLNASDFEVIQLGWRGGTAPPSPTCTPGTPTDLWATVNGYTVQLGWTPPGGVLGHLVDVGSAPGLTNITSIPIAMPSTGLGGAVAAGRYYVRTRAAQACGAGAASNEVVVDVPAGCAVPTAPGTLAVALGANRTVSLTWGAAASATTYVVEAGSAPGLANILATDVGAARSVGGPVPPGTYHARVRGRSTCGQTGPASNEVVVVVP
ncbi:MAG: hypothetical protein KA371_07910 [Acidobacteria bacterium]|nr:hypothetical protein [Acidobacteriota bacterium]